MKLNFDLIIFKAEVFAGTLDITAVHIYDHVHENLEHSFRVQMESAVDWDEDDTGISLNHYENFILSQYLAQMRALTASIFTLMELQLLDFLKDVQKRFISRDRFPKNKDRYGRSGDGNLLRLASEYKERCGISFEDLPGFEICKEVVLARNSCVHDGGKPSVSYLTSTSRKFLHVDGYLILTSDSVGNSIAGLKSFTAALAAKLSERIRSK